MPTPMTPPALAGAGAMDQVPMLSAAAARTAIQRRECSEIFLKLSMFAFEPKSSGRDEPMRPKYAGCSPRQPPSIHPDNDCRALFRGSILLRPSRRAPVGEQLEASPPARAPIRRALPA